MAFAPSRPVRAPFDFRDGFPFAPRGAYYVRASRWGAKDTGYPGSFAPRGFGANMRTERC